MGKKIPEEAIKYLSEMLERMKLKINEEKTHMINAYEKSFDFLGFTFRYSKDLYKRNKKYWNIEPSDKAQKKIRSKVREYLKNNGYKSQEKIVKELNSILRGWINYFTINKVSYPSKAKRNLRYYLFKKLNRFYKRKSQRKCKLHSKGALNHLIKRHGLIDVTKYTPYGSTVKA